MTSRKSADSYGKKLLLEMANLRDDGAERFWKKWPFKRESSPTLYDLRDELRQIWEGNLSETEITRILDHWANYPHLGLQGIGYRQWEVTLRPPRILPQVKNLRGFLVFAVLIYLPFLAICGNPECPAKYFVGGRRNQKYCGGECTEYAQRQYALKYWNEQGKYRRKKITEGK